MPQMKPLVRQAKLRLLPNCARNFLGIFARGDGTPLDGMQGGVFVFLFFVKRSEASEANHWKPLLIVGFRLPRLPTTNRELPQLI